MYYYNIKCIKRVYAAFCTLLFHSEGSVHEGRKRHIRNLQLIKLKIQTEEADLTCVKRLKKCCGIVDKKVGKREDKKVRMKWRSNREAYVIKSHQRIIKSHHG